MTFVTSPNVIQIQTVGVPSFGFGPPPEDVRLREVIRVLFSGVFYEGNNNISYYPGNERPA